MKFKIFVFGLLNLLLIPIVLAASFPDVNKDHPNYYAIEYLKEKGVIQGYPNGDFRPNNSINRAETLKIILLGSSISVPEQVTRVSFPDFSANDWFAIYVERAKDLGIVEGYPDGNFRPANPVNLVENLKMLIEANEIDVDKLYDNLVEDPYADTPKEEWYAKYIQYAKDKGLIDADLSNYVYPGQVMNRGTFAEVVYRMNIVDELGLEYFDPEVIYGSNNDEVLNEALEEFSRLLEGDEVEDDLVNYADLWSSLGF